MEDELLFPVVIYKVAAVVGGFVGLLWGFVEAGIGGAIVGAPLGAAAGAFFLVVLARLVLPGLAIVGTLLFFGAIAYGVLWVIGALWGVGKP